MVTIQRAVSRVKLVLPFCLFAFLPIMAAAQDEPEYRLEIGGGIGLVAYQGDMNGSILKNQQPMLSIIGKYRFSPRTALGANISYGQLKGDAKGAATYYPATGVPDGYSFKSKLADVGVRYEYNFWPYGTGNEYRGARRLTPYIYIGVGVTIAKPQQTEVAMNMPLGCGVKYKVADRLNAAVEWTMHFTGSDLLDGTADPYGIKSSGLFKNTDCYSHLRLSLSYDLWAKCKTCHNDRD
ncbi:MAG: outer membrane beta-barrel protein [Prevotella sp.]|nr:outer membrane beta-barrel protein [Prevotella sp.]